VSQIDAANAELPPRTKIWLL